jgi:hypothetical protein
MCQHTSWGSLEGSDTVRRFHHGRLQHTFAVAAGVGADWLGTDELGEGIEVGCFPGLAELNGASKARKHLMGFGKHRGADQHVTNAHSSAGQIPRLDIPLR